MLVGGILSEKEYDKITIRHAKLPKIEPIQGPIWARSRIYLQCLSTYITLSPIVLI